VRARSSPEAVKRGVADAGLEVGHTPRDHRSGRLVDHRIRHVRQIECRFVHVMRSTIDPGAAKAIRWPRMCILSHCLKDKVTERSSLPPLGCYPQTRMRHPLQKRVRAERRQAVQRLIGEVRDLPPYIASDPSHPAAGNILSEAPVTELREATRQSTGRKR